MILTEIHPFDSEIAFTNGSILTLDMIYSSNAGHTYPVYQDDFLIRATGQQKGDHYGYHKNPNSENRHRKGQGVLRRASQDHAHDTQTAPTLKCQS